MAPPSLHPRQTLTETLAPASAPLRPAAPSRASSREETRRKLIEGTIDCLVTDGYPGLTIRKITERAGLSRGAPLRHFTSKADLIEAAAQEVVARLSDRMAAAYRRSRHEPHFAAAFGVAVWQDLFATPEGAVLAEFVYASRHDPEIGAVVQNLWTEVYHMANRFARTAIQGTHPDITPEKVVLLSQWLMRGMVEDLNVGLPPTLFEGSLHLWGLTLGEALRADPPGGREVETGEYEKAQPTRGPGR